MPQIKSKKTGDGLKTGFAHAAIFAILFLLAFACIFIFFQRDLAEKALSRAKNMRVEITVDEEMIESFSESVDRFFNTTTARLKAWTRDLMGAEKDDVAAQLQSAPMGVAQSTNEEFDLADGI